MVGSGEWLLRENLLPRIEVTSEGSYHMTYYVSLLQLADNDISEIAGTRRSPTFPTLKSEGK
uniref:Uncharacterized protein n=1 Tax=Oryza punctata TaxID=4537 RepID=A0A0E0MQ16_ORYPU